MSVDKQHFSPPPCNTILIIFIHDKHNKQMQTTFKPQLTLSPSLFRNGNIPKKAYHELWKSLTQRDSAELSRRWKGQCRKKEHHKQSGQTLRPAAAANVTDTASARCVQFPNNNNGAVRPIFPIPLGCIEMRFSGLKLSEFERILSMTLNRWLNTFGHARKTCGRAL